MGTRVPLTRLHSSAWARSPEGWRRSQWRGWRTIPGGGRTVRCNRSHPLATPPPEEPTEQIRGLTLSVLVGLHPANRPNGAQGNPFVTRCFSADVGIGEIVVVSLDVPEPEVDMVRAHVPGGPHGRLEGLEGDPVVHAGRIVAVAVRTEVCFADVDVTDPDAVDPCGEVGRTAAPIVCLDVVLPREGPVGGNPEVGSQYVDGPLHSGRGFIGDDDCGHAENGARVALETAVAGFIDVHPESRHVGMVSTAGGRRGGLPAR